MLCIILLAVRGQGMPQGANFGDLLSGRFHFTKLDHHKG